MEIKLKDFTKPLELAFVLLGGTGDARGKIEIQIVDEADRVLVASPKGKAEAAGVGKRLMTAIGITHVYPGPGRYSFRLLVDGKRHYDAAFTLLQGAPADFQV